MRVFTPGMKVIDGLRGTRVCLLLVFVFACSSASVTAANNIPVPLRRPSNLTSQERNSSVTIVFKNIGTKNRTAVDFARREVRRKILDYLNRKKSIAASTSWATAAPSTSIVSTANVTTSATPDITTAPTTQTTTAAALTAAPTTRTVEDTTQSLTTVATSAVTTQSPVTTIIRPTAAAIITEIESNIYTSTRPFEPPVSQNRKRRRRDSDESSCPITEKYIIFVENDHETDEDGNLRISLSSDNEASECKDIIFKVLTELDKPDEEDGLKTIAPVVKIFRGLPPVKAELAEAGYQIWLPILLAICLPILLAICLVLIVFIFVCCWKATHKKGKAKIIPTQDFKPSPWNGHAPQIVIVIHRGS